jgi:hypothetical protein
MWAVRRGHMNIVTLLVARKANANLQTEEGIKNYLLLIKFIIYIKYKDNLIYIKRFKCNRLCYYVWLI